MKTLSIKQPFASLIAHGIKDIENRTWKTNFRGRIYIHAGMDKGVLRRGFTDEQLEICSEAHKAGKIPTIDLLPLGAIIGEVNIIDCVINHPSIWAEKSSSYSIYEPKGIPASLGCKGNNPIYNWVLANAGLYDEPILKVKGKLSLWEFNKELA